MHLDAKQPIFTNCIISLYANWIFINAQTKNDFDQITWPLFEKPEYRIYIALRYFICSIEIKYIFDILHF